MIAPGILMGGTSSEHEISLKTGNFLFKTLKQKYSTVRPILITKSGQWLIPKESPEVIPDPSGKTYREYEEEFTHSFPLNSKRFIDIETNSIDCFVLGLHGGSGENGSIQGLLEILGIPYTGSGVLASALAMDKFRSNQIYEQNGFPVSPYYDLSRTEHLEKKQIFLQKDWFQFPVFVKPTCGGSSVNTGPVQNESELNSLLDAIFQSEDRALIQKPMKGVEVSCGVIQKPTNHGLETTSLYPTEIIPKNEFFDYKSKYMVGGSEEITPARLSPETTERVRNLALLAHTALGCLGYSRTDFIIENEIPLVLETNTLPGMTETSLIPQQIRHIGWKMEDFLDWMIEIALRKKSSGF